MRKSFVCGMVTGAVVGVGALCYALNELRPEVTSRIVRDGRKVLKRYRKMMST